MFCKGTMEKKTATFHIDHTGYHLQMDAVDAWVCTQCGEAYFEEKEVQEIQNVQLPNLKKLLNPQDR